MANAHLTDGVVKRLPVPKTGNRITYDDEVAGFGCRVTAAGARSFVLNYRTPTRERRLTIGPTDRWSTSDARREANRLLRQIDEGGDPLGDLQMQRQAASMLDLCNRFEREYMPRRLRPSTLRDYQLMINKWIRPHFKTMKVADVAFADVERLHHRITDAGHGARANSVSAVVARMLALSVRWGYRADNPAKGIERNAENKRRRYLSGDELQRLTAALGKYPDKASADFIRMLLLTGARRGETMAMRWSDVDLSAGTWVKPGATTKTRMEHTVPLSAPARQLLAEIRERQKAQRKVLGEHVFEGNGSPAHVVAIRRAWRRLCKTARLDNLRLHDLRHSFASQLASGGASLPLIGALLGHTQVQTTARYAHLFDDPQRKAVESVGAIIEAAGKPVVAPTPLRRGGSK